MATFDSSMLVMCCNVLVERKRANTPNPGAGTRATRLPFGGSRDVLILATDTVSTPRGDITAEDIVEEICK
jgi:hypothetical protein